MGNDKSPDFPIYRERVAILARESATLPGGRALDLELLAKLTCGFTANDLANLCRFAQDAAADSGADTVAMADFSEALASAIRAGARPALLDPCEREQAAYYQAGRVLVAWHVYGVKPAGRVTILADQRCEMYKVTAQLDSEQNAFLACLDLALAGIVAEEMAPAVLPEAECQADRPVELAKLCLAAQGASPATIEDQVQPLVDERRQHVFRELVAARSQLDRLADLLIREEAVEPADAIELLRL